MNAHILLLALAPFLSHATTSETPQDSVPRSLARVGDGAPTCGLGKEFHAGRRKALCEALDKKGVVVVRGLPESRDYLPFRQDKVFWYLTGIESPNTSMVMDCATGHAVLFLPPQNKFSESWNGELWDAGDEWVKDLTGFTDVRKNSELHKALAEALGKDKQAWVSLSPNVALAGCIDQAEGYDRGVKKDELDGRESREQRLADRLKELFGAEVSDLSSVLDEMRRVKQPEEIDAMRRAGRAGAIAMTEAMRSTRPGVGEWEIDGLMSFVQVKEGSTGPAYGAIVGSGKNSLVLHYMGSAKFMRDGEMLLIDYAPELDHYTSDITRSWPVNGTFDARQAEIYDAVLASQLAGIAAVKPGATIGQVSAVCNKVLKERGFGKMIKHGPCHYIGMEVHDVGEYDKPLVPGVAFTIEPGVYESETGIGVRIEDVVIVTADGCEVVSDLAPKERAAVERTVREEGVLDWMSQARRPELASKAGNK